MVNCQTMPFIKKPKLVLRPSITHTDTLKPNASIYVHERKDKYPHKQKNTHILYMIYTYLHIYIANNYSIRADQVAKMQKANNFGENTFDKY